MLGGVLGGVLSVVVAAVLGQEGQGGSASAATTAGFVDAADGVYWHSGGMRWAVNGTHVIFPRAPWRRPVPLRELYFLAGVAPPV